MRLPDWISASFILTVSGSFTNICLLLVALALSILFISIAWEERDLQEPQQ